MAATHRPVIGINMDVSPAAKGTKPILRLSPNYAQAVLHAGGLPVLMPPFAKEADQSAFLDRVDGFLLTGGLDLDPRRYGQPWHASVHPMSDVRDESDRILLKAIFARQMPVLGIGLGMQQLCVTSGGALYTHLPEQLSKALPHMDASTTGPHRHRVNLVKNSRLDDIYGDAELLVVSNHHQAVRQITSQWRVAATAPDGVIEAIESTDPNWFALGLQWHPEADAASALEMQLFECFLQACGQNEGALALAA